MAIFENYGLILTEIYPEYIKGNYLNTIEEEFVR